MFFMSVYVVYIFFSSTWWVFNWLLLRVCGKDSLDKMYSCPNTPLIKSVQLPAVHGVAVVFKLKY